MRCKLVGKTQPARPASIAGRTRRSWTTIAAPRAAVAPLSRSGFSLPVQRPPRKPTQSSTDRTFPPQQIRKSLNNCDLQQKRPPKTERLVLAGVRCQVDDNRQADMGGISFLGSHFWAISRAPIDTVPCSVTAHQQLAPQLAATSCCNWTAPLECQRQCTTTSL